MENSCILTDTELVEKCHKWILDLCTTKGNAWMLRVPADANHDPDLLFTELINRFEKSKSTLKHINNLSHV
jgi:hypothetical protein